MLRRSSLQRRPLRSVVPTIRLTGRAAKTSSSERIVIELRKLEEKFVNADEVKVAYFNEVRTLRDRGFNIPDRIAAQLAAESEVKKCWEILMGELRQLFQNCADGWITPMEPGSSGYDTHSAGSGQAPEQRKTAPVPSGVEGR